MTISILVRTPSNKGARITKTTAAGVETTDVPAGSEHHEAVHDSATISIAEIDQAESAVENEQLESGGGGHGDPDKPK